MLIKICPGEWKTQLKTINHKVDEDNGKALEKGNVHYINVCWFSINEFGKTLVVSFQLLPLVLGGQGYGRRNRI